MEKKYNIKYSLLVLIPGFLIIPLIAFGADFNLAGQNFKSLVGYVRDVINILIPILFGLAFIVFFWGLSKFILSSGNKDAVEKGKRYMMWSIFALFILVSFQSIISIVSKELELGPGNELPLLPTSGGGNTPSVNTNSVFTLPDGTVLGQ